MYFSATAFNNDCITAQKNAQHGHKAARMSYSVSTFTQNFWQIVVKYTQREKVAGVELNNANKQTISGLVKKTLDLIH